MAAWLHGRAAGTSLAELIDNNPHQHMLQQDMGMSGSKRSWATDCPRNSYRNTGPSGAVRCRQPWVSVGHASSGCGSCNWAMHEPVMALCTSKASSSKHTRSAALYVVSQPGMWHHAQDVA
ncbi:hypothetical protein HaLaN_25350 [Haematococcus lacustris]|uniref:Uncharacterized protein n=1 Tax=Haematococcus lacustris TaxID=44745 RepID=A0A699ZVZ5_HAELA|nr:hypothetical protein HaLaN_25350 [Haematococcus lacustris]